MADDRYRTDYPQHTRPEENQSQYSRPSGEGSHYQQHGEAPRTSMAASMTLPSIHDSRGAGYGPQQHPQAHAGYGPDPRYASPNAVNGYPPPPPGQQAGGYLPPLQPPSDPRASSSYPPPPDQRSGYYDDRRPPYGQEQYPPPDAYYYSRQGPPINGYPRGPPPPPGTYPVEYGQPPPGGTAQVIGQAAPRQRTSIACKYCRKRKIRCTGYQSGPGGKCQNCARMNQECIFQPVSSSSSTAFIPVSALPGGVPPGTQLYGAYGQPLTPNSVPQPPPAHPYPPAAMAQGQAPMPPNYYQPVQQSPTESFSSYGEPRADENPQMAGRRRRRTSEEQDEGYRLPPPKLETEDSSQRRSPAKYHDDSSPGGQAYPPYGASRQSPRGPPLATAGGRSPGGQNGSSGASTPVRQGGQGQGASVMSLSNLVDKNDIDKGMIDRLNRPKDSGTPQGGMKHDAGR